jgi:hypothetical protein
VEVAATTVRPFEAAVAMVAIATMGLPRRQAMTFDEVPRSEEAAGVGQPLLAVEEEVVVVDPC